MTFRKLLSTAGFIFMRMISRYITPPTILIGVNVVEVVPRVRSLGFVLNERLTATDHFAKVCQRIYWILRSLRPHAHTLLRLEEDLFCRSFCRMSIMVILCLLPHRRGD
jgi:hypothetical protein